MQSTGQASTQRGDSYAPTHSVQRSWAMTNVVPSELMAPFEHSGSHALQLMHSARIFIAMAPFPFKGRSTQPLEREVSKEQATGAIGAEPS